MASRRFFDGYDPYDCYYAAPPANYPYPYYNQHHPAPASPAGAYFPAAGDADQYHGHRHEPAVPPSVGGFSPAARNVKPAVARAAVRPRARASRSVSVPVRVVASDPEPEVARVPVRRAPSADEAAVRLQAAARGFLARRAVRALRAVAREAEEVAGKVARDAEALRGDARARVGVGEELMRLLLRLDAVRGAREYRRRVTRRVLALQDAVDALEHSPAPAAVAEEAEADAAETTTTAQMAEGNAVAVDLPESGEDNNGEVEDKLAAETTAAMEVDGGTAVAEDAEPAPDGTDLGGDKPADEDADSEWEMVAKEPAAIGRATPHAPQPQEPAEEETTSPPAEADGGVDSKKLMEMVAALCEQSAQQSAVIGALAERVDALERAVRRVDDAERRRRRDKKLQEDWRRGRGAIASKCYSD